MAINQLNNTATSSANKDTSTQFTADKWATQKLQAKSDAANGTNPMAQLDKEAFLKLLLTELQYQDPTDPMDTAKMLEQTSQLSVLEAQNNTNELLKNLAEQIQNSFSMTSIGALGKVVKIDGSITKATKATNEINFNLNFSEAAAIGTVEIKDSNGKVVKVYDLEDQNAGIATFTWDGTDNDGNPVDAGKYYASATYLGKTSGNKLTTGGNEYPIEAVKFKDGTALVKINGQFVDINDVGEIYEPKSNS
nr:flagellar biosynthesis protein FlgD [Campylobacter sp.]